jgi:hypothetical protein
VVGDVALDSETHVVTLSISRLAGPTQFFRGAHRGSGDVPVDSEAPVMTSSISRFAGPTQFFGGAHRSSVCMRMFIGVSVCSCTWI